MAEMSTKEQILRNLHAAVPASLHDEQWKRVDFLLAEIDRLRAELHGVTPISAALARDIAEHPDEWDEAQLGAWEANRG